MNKYKCKCGNEKDFFIEHNLSQCGLYCGECGKWQKWLNKDEERLFKYKQELAEHDKQIRDEERERIINELQKVGTMYCTNVHCNMECLDCEHGSLMRAIVKIVGGAENE